MNSIKNGVSRRNLVKGAAAAAVAGMAAATGVAAAEEAPAANRVCELFGIERPVMQAAMLGLTSPELVAAVSNAGGMGVLAQGGDLLPDPDDVRAIRALTDKPFAVLTCLYTDEMVELLRENDVQVVIAADGADGIAPWSGNGYQLACIDLIRQLKEAGFTVAYKGLNITLASALAVQEAGADAIIMIGKGAGGSGPVVPTSIFSLLSEMADQIEVPIIAAGGIVDGLTARNAAALGAEGAYCGTRFLACTESPVADSAKELLVETRSEDMIEINCGISATRVTRTPITEEYYRTHGCEPEGDALDEAVMAATMAYADLGTGNLEGGINCGEGINRVTSILSAQEIVDDIASGFLA